MKYIYQIYIVIQPPWTVTLTSCDCHGKGHYVTTYYQTDHSLYRSTLFVTYIPFLLKHPSCAPPPPWTTKSFKGLI